MLIMWVTDKGEPEPDPKPADMEYTGFADGFPIPPLPGQRPVESPRAGRAPVVATASKEDTDE